MEVAYVFWRSVVGGIYLRHPVLVFKDETFNSLLEIYGDEEWEEDLED